MLHPRVRPHSRPSTRLAIAAAATAAIAALISCSNIEKVKAKPQSAKVEGGFQINAPPIMRGTVGSQATIEGYQPVVVRGYGLVVGLKGTGSRGLPQDLRAHMIAMAAKQGVGSANAGWGHITPEELLESPDTAVVIVEGLVPPGAKEGTRFDVRVVPHPATSPESLEGGRLWTASLQPALGAGLLPPTGMQQAAAIAEASGPVFINPFAEPGAMQKDTINRNLGRVLDGGSVVKDMPMKLRLATPSHALSRSLQGVINAQFPREPGEDRATAHGESDETLELTVPPSYRDDPKRFVDLLRCTSLVRGAPESTALNVRRLLLTDPSNAPQASLRWQTLGPRALPIIRELYDYAEEQPRFAALEAGAWLEDALVVPHLIDLANRGSASVRPEAIKLLAAMPVNPRIDLALRDLVNDQDLEVRLASYEALIKRGDGTIRRVDVDGKFVVDFVNSDKPLIYISQMGRPRIALLGSDLRIERPVTVLAWSNRLMIKGGSEDDEVEVYYREQEAKSGTVSRVTPALREFVEFLGHHMSVDQPKAGLGLSYSEVVGALYQIWSQHYIHADFKAEQDRLLAAILDREKETGVTERPEVAPDEAGGSDGAASNPAGPMTGAAPRSELGQLAPPAPLAGGASPPSSGGAPR